MAPACQHCGGRVQKRDNCLCLPWCQTLQFLPAYHWCPSSCHPSAGSQREQVWVGESVCGFPKRNCLGLQQPPPPTQSLLVYAARSCGDLFIFPALEPWAGGPGVGLGLLAPKVSLWIFIHVRVGTVLSASVPLLPVWMDVVSSILYLSDFHST